ncbi:MAG: tRNA lysidine(34) synthetase TilS, partial [Tepidisphaeraceae bacterium]
MSDASLQSTIATIPPGPWAVGVSGGADSVGLLSLLRSRGDLKLVVVHLDHETRGGASAADARFVDELADRLGIPSVIATRSAIEPDLPALPTNTSARWRAIRFELFRRVVRERQLFGVILAHHADDQAETILHRLLRGSGPSGLAGMAAETTVAGLRVLRPLLGVRRDVLRHWLIAQGQAWREDESNASPAYARNRIRRLLEQRTQLVEPLVQLGEACGDVRAWLRDNAPRLGDSFDVVELRALPLPLARESL